MPRLSSSRHLEHERSRARSTYTPLPQKPGSWHDLRMSNEDNQSPDGIYRFTSVARPVDPAYPTNRALLIVLPIGAAVFAALALLGVVDSGPLSATLSAILVGFAAWALTRELAPDDDAAAFVALALAWIMSLLTGATSILLTFAALFLARIVNRTTGLAARPWDIVMVAGFVLWASWNLGQPLLALVAALAFAFDAWVTRTSPLGVAASVVCGGFSIWLLAGGGYELQLWNPEWLIPVSVLVAAAITSAVAGAPRSRCDVFQKPLSAVRVRAGLAIGGLVAFQSLVHGVAWPDEVIWACIAAVPLSAAARVLMVRLAL